MSTTFHNIALVGKYQSPDVAESVMAIARFLKGKSGINLNIAYNFIAGTVAETD